MISTKYKQLIRSLQQATETGKVEWKRTSLQTKFEVNLAPYKITVYVWKPEGFEFRIEKDPIAEIELMDADGSVFEKINTHSNSSEEYYLIEKLYEAARRRILNIDNKLDEILSVLDNPKK